MCEPSGIAPTAPSFLDGGLSLSLSFSQQWLKQSGEPQSSLTANNKSNRHANAGVRRAALKSSEVWRAASLHAICRREKRCVFVQLLSWHAALGGNGICSDLPNYCATHKG
jgi:hypothetical protein